MTGTSVATSAVPARPPRSGLRRLRELTVHLAARDLATTHRFTALGAGWPLVRLLAQWGVLAFVFGRVVQLDIEHYPVFLLCGLIAWSWFATALGTGTAAVREKRHLVLQPGLPALVLPAVAVAVAFADVLVALPVLLLLVMLTDALHPTALLLPLLVILQFALLCGLAWITSALAVYLRDVANLVDVLVALLFYVTPVFYELSLVPDGLQPFFQLNPMTALIEGWRDVLIDGRLPGAVGLLGLAAAVGATAGAGVLLFRRLEPGFADEL